MESRFGPGGSSRSKQAAPKRKGDSSAVGEVIRPSKMTARQREAEAKKKTKAAPCKTVDKLSLAEYTTYRMIDPYTVEQNPCVSDENFWNHSQEEVYTRIYLTMKNKVFKQHHINVDHMCKNHEYFGEALAMCEEFGLLPLMEFTQNWDEDLVVQF
jgi:hypothetical protein